MAIKRLLSTAAWRSLASRPKGLALVLCLFGAVLVCWVLWWKWGIRQIASEIDAKDAAKLGQVGDLFGGINALFAAFAFAGVALAAYFQYQTWKLQQEQVTRQSFEPLFFELLKRVPDPPRLRPSPAGLAGGSIDEHRRGSFEDNARGIRDWLHGRQTFKDAMEQGSPFPADTILSIYNAFYHENQAQLGTYFRALYHVFRLIWDSNLSSREKVRHANIVRATLNSDELLLLAINGLTDFGKNFRALIEEFGLLKHMCLSQVHTTVDQLIVDHLYAPSAHLSFRGRLKRWQDYPAEREDLDDRLAKI